MADKQDAKFNQWDVVVLPYPLTGTAGEIGARRRPALIVSSPNLHRDYDIYWLLMITSDAQAPQGADVKIEDWEGAGLPVPSILRSTKILTVSGRQILRKIGTLGGVDLSRATLEISRFIG